jgi:putative transposase
MLKAIRAQEDRRSAEAKIHEVIVKLKAMRLTKAAELVEAKAQEPLTYSAFPRQIKTNNPLERIIREIRR